MIISILIAVAIPLLFLYLVHWLDLYGSDRPKLIGVALAWGIVASGLAYLVNHPMIDLLGRQFVSTRTAPFVEEIFKSLILLYLVRRADFTYFVDGAIYGFAAGIAFAVTENMLYLSRVDVNTGLIVAIARAFSTSLMHGSATALVGIAVGRFRMGRGNSRAVALILGWAAAITLHISFNNLTYVDFGQIGLFIISGVGFSGLLLVAAFILWGLHEESKWLREELGEKLHVSEEEASIVQHMGDLDELLAPIEKRFGKNKRNQVARFLHLEAQLGLKQETEDKTMDPKLRAELASQIAKSEQELDLERRNVGVYVMAFVRAIMPTTDWSLWARLGQALTKVQDPHANLWNALGAKLTAATVTPGESAYTRVQAELDARTQAANLTVDHVNELPEAMKKCMHWVMKEETVAAHHVAAGLGHEEQVAQEMLSHLVSRGFLHRTTQNGQIIYRSRVVNPDERAVRPHVWQSLQKRLTAHS